MIAPFEVRKVRASAGRVQDNVLSGQLEGKCHRNIPPYNADSQLGAPAAGPLGGAQARSAGVPLKTKRGPQSAKAFWGKGEIVR